MGGGSPDSSIHHSSFLIQHFSQTAGYFMEFIRVAKASDIPDPGKQIVEVEDRLVVVFHVAGKYYALDDVCTHDGGPLGEGELDGFCIACPRHGAKFDIRDGRALTMPATRDTGAHEVKVEGGDVLVRLRDE